MHSRRFPFLAASLVALAATHCGSDDQAFPPKDSGDASAGGLGDSSSGGTDAGTRDAGSPLVVINEVESEGPGGDWVELFNAGTAPADVSGWTFLDNDDGHTPYVIPASTTIAPGGFYVLSDAQFG